MKDVRQGARTWKVFIVALAAAMALLDLWAASNWAVLSNPGGIGAALVQARTSHEAVVGTVTPGSTLAAAGVKSGDVVRFDRLQDMRRRIGAGEAIPMRVKSVAGWKPVEVVAEPLPPDTSFGGDLASAMVAIVVVVSIAMGAAIGLKRADLVSLRVFAVALLMQPLNIAVRRMAPGPIGEALSWLYPLVPYVAIYWAFAYFCLTFPEGARGRLGLRLRRVIPAYTVAALAVGIAGLAYQSELYGGSAFVTAANAFQVISVAIALAGLAIGWREAGDPARTRIRWIALSMGVVFASYLLPLAQGLPGVASWLGAHPYFNPTVILAGHLGLAYALLRHRIFDIGFVVNRALVYGSMSAAMLLSFGLLEWLVHKAVHFEAQQHNAFLDAAIALGVFLAFNKVHHRAEHAVETVFFRSWRRRDEELRAFVARAADADDRDALLRDFDAALARYTGDAQRTILLSEAPNELRDPRSGETLRADDRFARALREARGPLIPADADLRPGLELAVPLGHRGAPSGFVLLGRRPGVGAYRPDEVDQLAHAAQQIGLDLHALEVERLRFELAHARVELDAMRTGALASPSGSPPEMR